MWIWTNLRMWFPSHVYRDHPCSPYTSIWTSILLTGISKNWVEFHVYGLCGSCCESQRGNDRQLVGTCVLSVSCVLSLPFHFGLLISILLFFSFSENLFQVPVLSIAFALMMFGTERYNEQSSAISILISKCGFGQPEYITSSRVSLLRKLTPSLLTRNSENRVDFVHAFGLCRSCCERNLDMIGTHSEQGFDVREISFLTVGRCSLGIDSATFMQMVSCKQSAESVGTGTRHISSLKLLAERLFLWIMT